MLTEIPVSAASASRVSPAVAAQRAQPWPDAVEYLREFGFHGVQFCSFRKFSGPAQSPI